MTVNPFIRRGVAVLAVVVAVAVSPGLKTRGSGARSFGSQRTEPTAPITVTIAPDVLARAGILTAVATRGRVGSALRIPATVQPNAYGQVAVVATAAGRVIEVPVQLGQRVAKGAPVFVIHSPELAETERAYVARQADLDLMRQQVTRLERLVSIGAASQQELDTIRAQQTSSAADLESVRARLMLLGRTAGEVTALKSPDAISARVTYVAPIAGTVTARAVNPGQTIESGAAVLTLVDLSTVWVIGDVYERDLAVARTGQAVTLASAALPGEAFRGRIAYVDPQLSPETRTARVRVELPNSSGRLLLGMLMEMRIETAGGDSVLVPRSAIQTIGAIPVVYIADAAHPGQFSERSVRLGGTTPESAEILSGVSAGDRVVTSGSFLVRSERDRTSPGPPRPVPAQRAEPAAPPPQTAPAQPKVFDVTITKDGFVPSEITVPAGSPVRLRFTRQVEKTCATEVVFPALKITKPLPLGKPVVIDLPAQAAGRLSFACGMDMFKGQVVVR